MGRDCAQPTITHTAQSCPTRVLTLQKSGSTTLLCRCRSVPVPEALSLVCPGALYRRASGARCSVAVQVFQKQCHTSVQVHCTVAPLEHAAVLLCRCGCLWCLWSTLQCCCAGAGVCGASGARCSAAVQVRVSVVPGKKTEHQGIKVQLLGQIELKSERSNPSEFTSLGTPGVLCGAWEGKRGNVASSCSDLPGYARGAVSCLGRR